MKPNRFLFSRLPLGTGVSVCFAASFLASPVLQAAPIIWRAPSTVAGDTDVVTAGTLAYAYTLSNTTPTVNGVAFTGSNSTTALGTNVTLAGFTGGNNTTTFGTGAVGTAYGNLSAGYQNLLKGADWTSSNTAATVTLKNLTVGQTYAVQLWVNDSRTSGSGRNAVVTSTGGNSVTLDYNNTETTGGVGQYSIGTFTADAVTQVLTITGNSSSQLQSMQVRNINGLGLANGVWNTTTTNQTWSTAASWLGSSIASGSAMMANFGTLDITADTTARLDSSRTIGSLIFGDITTSTAGSWTLDNNGTPTNVLTLAGTAPSITVNALGTGKLATVSTNIAGTSGLLKSGAGILALAGTNTFSGNVSVAAGTLRFNSDSSLGDTANSVNVTGASTLQLGATISSSTRNISLGAATTLDTNGFNLTHSGTISGTGALTKGGTGTLTLSGTNTFSGGVSVSAGSLVIASPSALGALPANIGSNSINAGGNTVEIATDTSINAYNLNVGSGVNSTYLVNRATTGPGVTHTVGSFLGGTNATINFTSGANNTSTPTIVCPLVTLSSGAGNSGQYTLNPVGVNIQVTGSVGNTLNSTNVDKGLTLSGSSTGNLVSGVIGNGSNAGTGKLPLVKSGTGTWTLTGVNTYTGITNVNSGTLAIGTGGSISSSPVINVASGSTLDITAAGLTLASSQTLIGNGTVSGTLTTSSGAKIAAGNTPTTATGNAITGAVGTLSVSSLTLASGTTLDFEFGTGNDQITVSDSNGLVINGGAINLYASGGTTAFSTNGTYTLFNYTGTLGGSGMGALSIANAQVGKLYNFADTGSAITLTISDAPTPADWAVDAGGSWADAANWSSNPTIPNATSALAYIGGTTSPAFTSQWTITLDGGRTVGALTLDNGNGFIINQGTGGSLSFDNGSAASSLTNSLGTNALNVPLSVSGAGLITTIASGTQLTASGAISGSGNLSQSGTGLLVLGADNSSFSGAITIAAGAQLQVGNAGSAGSLGSGAVVNNGSLSFSRTDSALVAANNISGTGTVTNLSTAGSITLSGNLSGSVSLSNSSAGELVLSGNNSYTGSTNIFDGVVVASGGSAIPNTGAVSITDATGVLFKLNASETIGTLNGGGSNGGNVDLQSNTLSISGTGNSTYSGVISGTGGLAKSGAGTLTLNGANTFSGGFSMSAGIAVAGNAAAFSSGSVVVNTGSTRFVVSDGLTLTNNITLNGGGASLRGLIENSGSGTATVSGTITVNSLTSGGGHFASTGGGVLAITGPINSSVALASRIGNVVVSGGGSYATFGVGEGTLGLGANNGFCTTATLDVGNVNSGGAASLDLAGFNQTVAGITHSGTVGGCFIGNSSTTADSTLTVTGTSTYSAGIKDALGAGTQKVLLVVDGGNLTLSGANTFTGGTTLVNNATVNAAVAGALSSGTVAIPVGSTVNTTAAAAFTFKPTGAGTLNFTNLGLGATSTTLNADNSGFTGTVNIGPSTAVGGGKVQLNSPTAGSATINVLANATLYTSAAVTHLSPIVLNGGDTGEALGQLRLEGGAIWSGAVTLAGDITGTGDFTIGGNTTAGTISGNIGESGGARALSKGGSGTITFSGTNSYTGVTTVAAGNLVAGSSGALGTTDAGTVVNNAASLRLANNVTITGESVTINGNGGNARGALQADAGATATWAGPVLIGATADSRIGAQANGTLTVSGAISSSGGADLIVSADVTGGKVVLTGTGNTYTGQTQIIRGLLQLGATNTLPTGTTLNIHSATGVADAASVDLNGFNQQVGGLLRGNNSGAASLTNSSLTASTLTISNTASFTYDSPITGNLSLVKSGTGTQTLTGTSSYTGATSVNGGVLNVNSSSAIGDGSATNTLVLNGGTLQAGGAITSPSTRGVTLVANSTLDTVANAVSIAGAVSGSANLTKSGSGTLTLSGANTYTGNTVVNAGTLELTSTSQQAFTIGANGVNTSISGTGTVTIDGTFNLNLAGADLTNGNSWTLVNAATLTESFTTNFNIPGFTQVADVWTKVDGTKTWTFTESTGVLSLTVSSGAYATWASGKGLTTGVNDGKDQDPDNDGRTNAMEFAFDGDPLSSANDGKVSSKVASVGGDQVLTLTVPVRSSATFSDDSVTHEEVSAVVDTLVYRIQGSSDLSAWTRDVSEVTATGDLTAIQAGLPTLNAGWTYRTFRAPGTVAADVKDFLRAVIQPQ